jgi:hypothetical protein
MGSSIQIDEALEELNNQRITNLSVAEIQSALVVSSASAQETLENCINTP